MFEKIVILDRTGLKSWAVERLSQYSRKPIAHFDDIPESDSIIIDRIKDADCILVSWHTQLTAAHLSHAPKLRYVGMCCSLYDAASANVDIDYCMRKNIRVTGIRDYGDEGLVEFIISELIRLLKGLGPHQWRDDPVELSGRKIGIIGMGTTGQMLTHRLNGFGADLSYYNRSRKADIEALGCSYKPLDELLTTVDVLSLHLPRNSQVLGAPEFEKFGDGKILINTSLGLTFDKGAFEAWISRSGNYAIFDGDGIGEYSETFKRFPNVISTKKVSGWTEEAKGRLSEKVLENLEQSLAGKSHE